MPEPLVWKFLIHIILGVEHMHYKNYIHRDLKTLNIFLTKDNIARVGDLGLAMKIEQNEEKETMKNIKEDKEEKDEKDQVFEKEVKEEKDQNLEKEEEEKQTEIDLVEN